MKLYSKTSLPSGIHISGTCDNTYVSGPIGYIISPNYPENYDNLENCTWSVTTSESWAVALQFIDLRTEKDSDEIFVSHGLNSGDKFPRQQVFSGTTNPSDVLSLANQMQISFIADGITTNKGFRIRLSPSHPEGIQFSYINIF